MPAALRRRRSHASVTSRLRPVLRLLAGRWRGRAPLPSRPRPVLRRQACALGGQRSPGPSESDALGLRRERRRGAVGRHAHARATVAIPSIVGWGEAVATVQWWRRRGSAGSASALCLSATVQKTRAIIVRRTSQRSRLRRSRCSWPRWPRRSQPAWFPPMRSISSRTRRRCATTWRRASWSPC